MSGVSKSTVLKSTPNSPSGPGFGGLTQKLSDPGGSLDLVRSSDGDSKTVSIPPSMGGGATGRLTLLNAMTAMGANPETCTLAQVIAFLSFMCPSLATRAVQLGWSRDQIIAAMQMTRAPQSPNETTNDSQISGSQGESPESNGTPTSTSFPTSLLSSQIMPSAHEAEQSDDAIPRDNGRVNSSADNSGSADQPQAHV